MTLSTYISRSANNVTGNETAFTEAARQPIAISVVHLNTMLDQSIKKIAALPEWANEWQSQAVSHTTMEYALAWLFDMFAIASRSSSPWHQPNIFASPDAEAVFEWWHQQRSITVYTKEATASYLKAWGPDIYDEMEDGDATAHQVREMLWSWLHS